MHKFDLQALEGETNGDNGLTMLNYDKLCVPELGSFNGDNLVVTPTKLVLYSLDDYAIFTLSAEGKVVVSLPPPSHGDKNAWSHTAKNGKTFAENTSIFLEKYVLKTGGTRKVKRKSNKTRKQSARIQKRIHH